MEFKRYDGYVNHIPQEFIDYHLPVCPFCRSNIPHWLLAQKADLTISGGRNYYRCDRCGATLSSTILDAAAEKGKAFAINPAAAALHAIHKGRSGQGVTVPYLRVEELGRVCQRSDWLGQEKPVTYFQEIAKESPLTPDAEKVDKPIPESDNVKETVFVGGNASSLLKRAFMFLEDGNWNSADQYCERVLDIDPECAEAYLGKLMAELKVNKKENLKNRLASFEKSHNYQKILRFGDDALKTELNGYIEAIARRVENVQKEKIYQEAREYYKNDSIPNLEYATSLLRSIISYKDSIELIEKISVRIKGINEQAEQKRLEEIYTNACKMMESNWDIQWDLNNAIYHFQSIANYKDSAERIINCENRIEELDKAEEIRTARNRRIAALLVAIVMIAASLWPITSEVLVPLVRYNNANKLFKSGDLYGAKEKLSLLSEYDNYAEQTNALYIQLMDAHYAKGEYGDALDAYKHTKGYNENSDKYKDMTYKYAQSQLEKRAYSSAITAFEKCKDYKDSNEKIKEAKYKYVTSNKNNTDSATYAYLKELKAIGYKDSAKIYQDLYTWKVELVWANTNSDDTSTIRTFIYRNISYFHYGFRITGGPPDETATFYHKTRWPDGSTTVSDWNWEDEEYGDYLGCEWSEGFSISSGTLTVEIYNNDTYELVGSFSIKVT